MTNENKKKIDIIGAGGFGREVSYLLNRDIFELVGYIDRIDNLEINSIPVIGHEDDIDILMDDFQFSSCVLAIGDIHKRKIIFNSFKNIDLEFPKIIHESIQSYSHEIEMGTIVYPNVVIMNDCMVGKFCLINSGVTLGHDVVIGDFCNINPGVHLAGRISIDDGSFIGIGASIKENIHIGKNAVIGAGSVVIADVPDGDLVHGAPAKSRQNSHE